ncbi:MAG: 50S ribosomal protein L30 [Prevotellaceae bacterium]|jgi:large subunit ribosomal protein L30|nr:50S ribosomal protein L30 [Prevotellaceae bacterium]
MAIYRITQIKSKIGSTKSQRATLETLGIRKMHHSVEREMTPIVAGMIKAVSHLVKVEEMK